MPRKDYSGFYEELGVSPDATAEEIKAAYRRLVKQVHPDVSKGPDSGTKFQQIQEAYGVLGNAARRLEYDVASGAMDGQADREAKQPSPAEPEIGVKHAKDKGGHRSIPILRWAAVSVAGLSTLLIVAGAASFWAWSEGFINFDQMFERPAATESVASAQPAEPKRQDEQRLAADTPVVADGQAPPPTPTLGEERLSKDTPAPGSTKEELAKLDPANTVGGQSLLLEASDNGKTGAVPFSGSVEWSKGTDEMGLPTLIGKAAIPARNLSVDVLIRKNSDPSLTISQLMEVKFRFIDSFVGGSVAGLPGVLLKSEELVQGTPLIGFSSRVSSNSFQFALSASPDDLSTNSNLLTSRKYMDLALIYATGKRAIITLEKDEAAIALFNEVVGDWSSPIQADRRIALVIGNSQYANVPRLYNVGIDATDVSAALERIGFKVTQVRNADYGQMRSVLQKFSADADGADIALIYYAGHGIEVENRNYLVPIDAQLKSDRDIDFETISLALVEGAVLGAKTLRMVILDACRNNPFAVEMALSSPTRSIGRGLSAVEPAGGVLIAYSAKGGSLANDVGEGRNSPFASAFIEYVDDPGLDVGFMFRKIGDAVMKSTDNLQEPFVYGRLPGDPVYLVAPDGPQTAPVADDPKADAVEVLRQALSPPGEARLIPEPGAENALEQILTDSAYVQLSSQPTSAEAQTFLRSAQKRLAPLLNERTLEVREIDWGAKGLLYRVVVPAKSFTEAAQLCATLKADGVQCVAING